MTYSHLWVPVMTRPSFSTLPSGKAAGPSRRLRHSTELRERLFRAALTLFGKKGYAETTVEDITEAADVGKGTFFNYFPTKEHILMAFGELQLAKLETIVRDTQQSDLPMQDVLRMLVLRMTEEPIRNPAMIRALLQANLSSVPVRGAMLRIHDRNRALLGKLIRHGQERGEIRTDLPPEEIAQVWRQTIFGTLLFWSLSGDASLSERIEQSLSVLWAGIVFRPSANQAQRRKKAGDQE
jgi:AcrR family transcriptional regulator